MLHAASVDEAIEAVVRGNGVTDEHCSVFKLVLYIQRFGSYGNYWRRLTDLYEVTRVEDARPVGQSLFRWQQEGNRFEKLAEPAQWGRGAADLARRTEVFESLAQSGRTSTSEVSAALEAFRAGQPA